MIESNGDGRGGIAETGVGSRVQFARRAFALVVDLNEPAPAVRCRVEFPLRPEGPKSPSLSLPNHHHLSLPPFIYL